LIDRKLDEEKFFLKVPGPVMVLFEIRDGEFGIGGNWLSLPLRIVLLEVDIAEETADVASTGLGPGNEELTCRVAALRPRGFKVMFEVFSCEAATKDADFGGSVTPATDSSEGKIREG